MLTALTPKAARVEHHWIYLRIRLNPKYFSFRLFSLLHITAGHNYFEIFLDKFKAGFVSDSAISTSYNCNLSGL